jgi:two-component system, probable response regulator PhcQ
MIAASSTATILLVDDEPQVTDALKRALRREPYTFLTAISASAAQELLERHHVDVVISDEQMPGMSGSQFLTSVRKQYPHTIRMILSGQASLDAAVRAINEGEVYRFFLKPCNPTDLIFTVQQALAHKRLEEQSRRLLREYQRQAATLVRLEHRNPGLLRLDTDDQGAVVVDEADAECDVKDLLAEIEQAISSRNEFNMKAS